LQAGCQGFKSPILHQVQTRGTRSPSKVVVTTTRLVDVRAFLTDLGDRPRSRARPFTVSHSPFDAETRTALAASLVPVPPDAPKGDKQKRDEELPRTRITAAELERIKEEAKAAGFSQVSKYIRWRLFG
jgi:hypothetical protein